MLGVINTRFNKDEGIEVYLKNPLTNVVWAQGKSTTNAL